MSGGACGEAGAEELRFTETTQLEVMRPLSAYRGAPPPAPGWFKAALQIEPQRSFVSVDGAPIEMLTWGKPGDPGVLFVHGTNAHADWWTHIAPFFSSSMRVAALSLAGMGASGWRDRYSVEGFAHEVVRIARAAGLFESIIRPVIVAHSFGGIPTLRALAIDGDYFKGAVLVDTVFQRPRDAAVLSLRRSPNRVMRSVEEAVMRFRLSPPQRCENAYILDHVARHSIKPSGDGVTWQFDPFIFRTLEHPPDDELIAHAHSPLALIRGELSSVVTEKTTAYVRKTALADVPEIVIPDAAHHVMLDQPLAFIAALRGLLVSWPT